MVRRLIVGAFLLAALLGCEPTDQSSPSSIPDGSRTIGKGMRGIWNAPGGTSCRWWIVSKRGTISNPGNTTGPVNRRRQKPGRAADQSQTVVIGSGNVGETFKSDRCAPRGWHR